MNYYVDALWSAFSSGGNEEGPIPQAWPCLQSRREWRGCNPIPMTLAHHLSPNYHICRTWLTLLLSSHFFQAHWLAQFSGGAHFLSGSYASSHTSTAIQMPIARVAATSGDLKAGSWVNRTKRRQDEILRSWWATKCFWKTQQYLCLLFLSLSPQDTAGFV